MAGGSAHAYRPHGPSLLDLLDTLRLLAHSQNGTPLSDVSRFLQYYSGPPDGVELVVSQEAIQLELSHAESDPDVYHPLATAVRAFGHGRGEWVSLIRRLLRRGADVHSFVPKMRYEYQQYKAVGVGYPCQLPKYHTALDELFMYCAIPCDAEVIGKKWLSLLSSEGYDVLQYLHREKDLHGFPPWTCPSDLSYDYTTPRQLIFELGASPSVSWEWYINPESPAALVRWEFRGVSLSQHTYLENHRFYWQRFWPFAEEYWVPDWLVRQRGARRRQKKAAKLARAQRLKWKSKMPGSWIS